jgi:hypothetical protein
VAHRITYRIADVEGSTHEAVDKLQSFARNNSMQYAEELHEEDFQREIARDSLLKA